MPHKTKVYGKRRNVCFGAALTDCYTPPRGNGLLFGVRKGGWISGGVGGGRGRGGRGDGGEAEAEGEGEDKDEGVEGDKTRDYETSVKSPRLEGRISGKNDGEGVGKCLLMVQNETRGGEMERKRDDGLEMAECGYDDDVGFTTVEVMAAVTAKGVLPVLKSDEDRNSMLSTAGKRHQGRKSNPKRRHPLHEITHPNVMLARQERKEDVMPTAPERKDDVILACQERKDGILRSQERKDDGILACQERKDVILRSQERKDDGILACQERKDVILRSQERKDVILRSQERKDGILRSQERKDDKIMTFQERKDDGILACQERKDDGILICERKDVILRSQEQKDDGILICERKDDKILTFQERKEVDISTTKAKKGTRKGKEAASDEMARTTTASSRGMRAAKRQDAHGDNQCCSVQAFDTNTLHHLSPLTGLEGVCSTVKAIGQWYSDWTRLCTLTKIAEGSYGSVFRLSDKQRRQEATIGKLMPLKPKAGKGSRTAGNSTLVADAATEVRLLELMSHVAGFVEFRSAEVLVGALPEGLKKEYRVYDRDRRKRSNSGGGGGVDDGGGSEGSGCQMMFPETQAWVFIEMGDAGTELEDALLCSAAASQEKNNNKLVRMNALGHAVLGLQEARDIFWGVAETLASGEEAQEFEHRDLHFSNICVKEKAQKMDCGYGLAPAHTNWEVTLIDYTLSRATLVDGSVVCNRMADGWLFEGENDLQFDVYRWMRDAMPGDDGSKKMKQKKNKDKNWERYCPRTNVFWLYHLLEKLLLQTPRPGQGWRPEERELWECLELLRRDLDPNGKPRSKLCSAADVLDYARRQKNDCVEVKGDFEDGDDGLHLSSVIEAAGRMRI